VPDALALPQVAERGFLRRFEDVPGVGRDILIATTGVTLDGAPLQVDTPPPELGRDNARIWGEIGLSAEEIAALSERGVI
jgi:formyl-CoA transferase